MPTMGEKIREARLRRGLTQGDLAEDLVTPSMISQIEAGKTKPSYPLLTAIANRLGLPVEHFLNDLQDQFALATHLRLAQYYLQVYQPQAAVDVLLSMDPPSPPGLQYQEYHLFLAKAKRMQGDIEEAVHLLEDLREQSYRHADRKLLFHVCVESGRTELAVENLVGTKHEWLQALEIGESILAADAVPSSEFRGEMAELCIALYQLSRRLGDVRLGSNCLDQARTHVANAYTVRSVADELVSEARTALTTGDSGRARTTAERAVSLLSALRWIEQSALVHAEDRRGSTDFPHRHDPWSFAASATAAADPIAHLDAEMAFIEGLFAAEAWKDALERLRQCRQFADLESPRLEATTEWLYRVRIALAIAETKALTHLGRTRQAQQLLGSMLRQMPQEAPLRARVQVLAALLQCLADAGDGDRALQVSGELAKLLEEAEPSLLHVAPTDIR